MAVDPGELRDDTADIRPLALDNQSWLHNLERARALGRVGNNQIGILGRRSTLDEAEFRQLFRYQVARSKPWQTFFEGGHIDWCDPAALERAIPAPGLIELAELTAGGRNP